MKNSTNVMKLPVLTSFDKARTLFVVSIDRKESVLDIKHYVSKLKVISQFSFATR